MEEMIGKLYHELEEIEGDFLDYQKRQNLIPVQQRFDRIQAFAVWFMEENRLDVEDAVWKRMSRQLLEILQDMIQAIEQGDYVLMHDAVTYGLMEYLALFLPVSAEEME